MPYIPKKERKKWNNLIRVVEGTLNEMPVEQRDGELNYFITSVLIDAYAPGYFNYNRAIGVLESIKQEFYRRQVGPYEDVKKEQNGDVQQSK